MMDKQKDYSPCIIDDSKQYTINGNRVKRKIVTAANRSGDIILVGSRHWDRLMSRQLEALEDRPKSSSFEEGFIDQYGQFLSRVDAKRIAIKNEQPLIGYDWGDELFSENLH